MRLCVSIPGKVLSTNNVFLINPHHFTFVQCFWTVVLEKTLESPLDCKEIKPVNPKGNQSWIFIGRTDAEAPILWPPDVKSQLIGKGPDARKDWRQEEKGMTEDEMVGWNHWLNGHEFKQTPGDSAGQGSLECCSPWGCKESDTTEQLNNNNSILQIRKFMLWKLKGHHALSPRNWECGCSLCWKCPWKEVVRSENALGRKLLEKVWDK